MNKLLNDPQAIGATFVAMIGAGMLVSVDLVRTQSDAETPGLGSTRRYRWMLCCFS